MRERWRRRRLMPRSVSLRAALAAGLVAAVLVGLGLDAWRERLVELRVAAMFDRADADLDAVVASLGASEAAEVRVELDVDYEVSDPSGRILAASAAVERFAHDGRRLAIGPSGEYAEILTPTTGDSPLAGQQLLILEAYLDTGGVRPDSRDSPAEADYVVRVFVPTATYLASSTIDQRLRWQAPLAVVLVAVVVGLVSRLALRPVGQMAAQAARISAGRLHHRLPEPSGRDPLARLAVTVNAMLDRLEDADARQRRFLADAAHELRSPLASLRTTLEVTREHPDRAALDAAIDEAERLGRLADDLLLLARIDARAGTGEGVVDIADLARDDASRRTRPVTVTAPAPVLVLGDEPRLRRMVANLVDNAVRHARTRVTVAVSVAHGRARLMVTDDGPGIPRGERERVFERFVRLDTARDRDAGGAGLGLAIVREIVTAHHGTVDIADDGPGATLTVDLPALDPSAHRVAHEQP